MSATRVAALLAASSALCAIGGGLVLAAGRGIELADPVLSLVATGLATTLLGLLLCWHRPENRMGAVLMAGGVLFGLSTLAAGVLGTPAAPPLAKEAAFAWVWLGQAPLVVVWALAILALPEGRVGRGPRRAFLLGSGLLATGVAGAQYLFAAPGRVPEFPPAPSPAVLAGPLAQLGSWEPLYQFGQALFPAVPLLALIGLVARFCRADPVARQQLKWVLVAAAVTVSASVLSLPLRAAGGGFGTAGSALALAASPLPALGMTLAVLRYRLWEVDLLVTRAIAYGLLWAALAAPFLALALAVGLLAGGSAVVIPVALALLVAFAGQPLRARLERSTRRLLYGDEPSGYAVVARFGEMLADSAHSGQIAERIADATHRALRTSWAGVWLRVESAASAGLRPAAVVGSSGGLGGSLLLLGNAAWLHELRGPVLAADLAPAGRADLGPVWDLEPAALAPLRAGNELVGILICGERANSSLAVPDLELLAVLAREAALALRNLRLEAELRSRIEEIEAQAEELRRSRRRLVAAQDSERRRIERDLHDGIQQQLVGLAAKLARASRSSPAEAHELLRQAAAEAEESVFALQELARGIYPSLLADQGLAAALRAHANRLPAEVRVEVEPALAGQRFGRELEAALYFVALEAMANAQKHAPGAALSVALRSTGDGRRLALEVHDDGPGFDPRRSTDGSGLQNMRDRLAAVGGRLEVESRRGAGTWVRADAPLEGVVVPFQRPVDSRR